MNLLFKLISKTFKMKTKSELIQSFEDESATLKSAEREILKFEEDCMKLIYCASSLSSQLASYGKLKDTYDEDVSLFDRHEIKEWVSDLRKSLLKEWLNKVIESLIFQIELLSVEMNKNKL
jgi:hypothetical protein